jgi:glycosyltransferase involved in cell wall biosynthesis
MTKPIVFVSSVSAWGGSEILWAETATALADKGYKITFAIRYKGPIIKKLTSRRASYIDLSQANALLQRALMKMKLKHHPFLQTVLKEKPQLVVINQGSNVDARSYMTICREHGIPYVTIAQLVTNLFWTVINDETINELRSGYANARSNYFVSRANLELHNTIIGDEHSNSKIILNPFTVPVDVMETYPPMIEGKYQIAQVGRLESYHKGQDLLFEVLKQRKWKERPATYNLYGSGPHKLLLERLIKRYGITNVVMKGFVNDAANIWKSNHLLVMPSRMEGQSLALIEAMWCYRPAVVTDVGGAREVVTEGETGFIAKSPTAEEIDFALEKAWSMRNEWEKLGKNAGTRIREIYQKHPITSFTEEIEQVLKQVS